MPLLRGMLLLRHLMEVVSVPWPPLIIVLGAFHAKSTPTLLASHFADHVLRRSRSKARGARARFGEGILRGRRLDEGTLVRRDHSSSLDQLALLRTCPSVLDVVAPRVRVEVVLLLLLEVCVLLSAHRLLVVLLRVGVLRETALVPTAHCHLLISSGCRLDHAPLVAALCGTQAIPAPVGIRRFLERGIQTPWVLLMLEWGLRRGNGARLHPEGSGRHLAQPPSSLSLLTIVQSRGLGLGSRIASNLSLEVLLLLLLKLLELLDKTGINPSPSCLSCLT
jgi:hypothetical protein